MYLFPRIGYNLSIRNELLYSWRLTGWLTLGWLACFFFISS